MNIRLNALWLSGSLALMSLMVAPAIADEWNKETKFEFSGPVEVPGKVLPAGKYVFKLADSDSDRNIVRIFSEDENGNQKFVTTILAIPDYRLETPDKTIIQFEERGSGNPEAIHAWFYPGNNTGWEFVYPKGERQAMSSNTPPAAAVVPAADSTPAADLAPAPDVTPEPALAAAPEPAASEPIVEEDVAIIAQNEAPALMPSPEADMQSSTDAALPLTGGYSAAAFLTGLTTLGGGVAMVFAARGKSQS